MSNLIERLAASAESYRDRPFVELQHAEHPGKPAHVDTFTYGQMARHVEQIAGWLTAQGVVAGERCAILSENSAHWVAAYFGALRIGAVAVPLDTNYKPKQIAALLKDCGALVFFTTERFLPALEEAMHLAHAQSVVALLSGSAAGRVDWQQLTAHEPEPLPPCRAKPADPAVILYSSGTTGDPKGVVLTHGNLLAEIDSVLKVIRLTPEDCILGVLPLFHALAQIANLLGPALVGARIVYLETLNTTDLLRALQQRGVSLFVCVPQFFYLIHQRVTQQVEKAGWLKRKLFRAMLAFNGALRSAGINLGKALFGKVHAVMGRRMRYLVTGGSRFDPAIGKDLYRMGFEILQAYGLTECSGAATVLRPGDSEIGSVGQVIPGSEIRTLPPEATAETGSKDGEVLIRGPIVMQGYYNRPDANAATLKDGWLHTGDLGYIDSRGRLFITGRKKEIIVLSSGKNIYPEEIEAHYLQSPYITDMCVMGRALPGEPSAERLHAVVVPDMDVMRDRKVLNMKEILRFEMESLSIGLPSHKRVLSYDIWQEDLPRTTTRKLRRFEIEKRVREGVAATESTCAADADAPAAQTEEEQLWMAQPDVARALEVINDAARIKGRFRPGANIELELGLDSMERVELLTHLEQMFGTDVPDEVAHTIYTVRELVEATRPPDGSGAGAALGGDAWGKLLQNLPDKEPALQNVTRPKPLFSLFEFAVLKLMYAAMWLLLGLRVKDRANLPAQGPYLICPNHQSFLDAFVLMAALPYRVMKQVFFVGASEYFQSPVMAWFTREINCVPVDPDANLTKAMQAGAFGLSAGKILVLFPEGERSIDGEVKKFKKGAAILSVNRKAPIVPVALDGIFEIWPRGRGFKWRALVPTFLGGSAARISVRFGPPLPPPDELPPAVTFSQAEAHYSSAAERLRGTVAHMLVTRT
jgi:long-chain acyl-CoA synthetase